MTASKHTLRRYQVRLNGTWGDFYLDGSALVIHSDYGSYGHSFYLGRQPDIDLRQFLVGADTHYLMKKLRPYFYPPQINAPETQKSVRQHILEHRREKDYTREEARREWDRTHQLHWGEAEVHRWHDETEIPDASELIESDTIPGALVGLMRDLWPHFIEQVEQELETRRKTEGT